MDHLHKLEDSLIMLELQKVVSHEGPLDKNYPNYKGSPYNVGIKQEYGNITEESLSIIAANVPVVCAIYTKLVNLLDKPG